ncbi:MAG: molybdenum cofactor biosynthesis protein MoaA [Thermoprotei archaeon]|nr:radical SAM protein [Thermoproteales archaeon]RLE96294.1 MAG: molybdenum cofactor biosynthesis protein MoaA [Thermoprotei archaeon]
MYDPVEVAKALRSVVCKGLSRKYYRFRGGRWYGGIATADCVGCNLRCVFCWGSYARDKPHRVGRFYPPEEVFKRLTRIAERRGYRYLRVSGNEPTLCREHLLALLELVESTDYTFILETNGVLIGYDRSYARDLSRYSNLHVRVSIKGASPTEFASLTGAKPEAFELQLRALENLLDYGVSTHPAVMMSFSSPEDIRELESRLAEIDAKLVDELEEEYVFLYPHVIEQLKRAGLRPRVAYRPDSIPDELV